jgi:urease accessory protein
MPGCHSPDQFVVSSAPPAPALPQDGEARLALGFSDDHGVTRLTQREHFGPLRVQKPLYPEGGAVCHAIIVHPPGGIVGGDRLGVTARVGDGARAFLATPGAAKWYKANGKVSRQRVQLQVGAGASLEWMPQESIFYDGCDVFLEHDVTLAADATYLGCEIACLGRRASGEVFDTGRITQRTSIRRGGKLVWLEQGVLAGAGPLPDSPLGMHGHSVCATLVAVGKVVPASVLAAVREAGAAAFGTGLFGATQMKSVIVVRSLGSDSAAARAAMLAAWRQLRPHLLGREAPVLRIWNT